MPSPPKGIDLLWRVLMDIDAKSPRGNAWWIIAAVRKLLIEVGRGDEVRGITSRMRAGTYDNLCNIAEEATNGTFKIVNRDGKDD